jgi:cobalt/nickel transport system permease protein
MDISKLDYWAYSGTSVIHRAGVASKLFATAFVIAGVVLTRDVAVLAGLLTAVVITVRAARLPVVKVLLIAIFPSFFALIFAISYASTGWRLPVAIMLKALTASSAMVLLVSTTPYTDVAGNIGRLLPRVVADGLFMTYRSFFILLRLMDNFVEALKLRGGFSPHRLYKNSRNMGAGLGMLFIRAFDKSQRLYEVMSVRGYSGKLSSGPARSGLGLADLPYTAVALIFLAYSAAPEDVASKMFMLSGVPLLFAYILVMEAFSHWTR